MSKTHSQSSSDTSDIIGFEQPITKKINDVDVYFLVVKISNEQFNIVGYENSKNVICKDAYDRHQNDSRFKGEGYVVYQEDLFEIKEEKIY